MKHPRGLIHGIAEHVVRGGNGGFGHEDSHGGKPLEAGLCRRDVFSRGTTHTNFMQEGAERQLTHDPILRLSIARCIQPVPQFHGKRVGWERAEQNTIQARLGNDALQDPKIVTAQRLIAYELDYDVSESMSDI